jgi:hypothetical protein
MAVTPGSRLRAHGSSAAVPEAILHALPWPAVLLDVLDGAPVEAEPHQRRLAALPRHGHVGRAVRLQQLLEVGLQRLVGQARSLVRVERVLGEEEAVLAVQVTGRPGRLGQKVKLRGAPAGRPHPTLASLCETAASSIIIMVSSQAYGAGPSSSFAADRQTAFGAISPRVPRAEIAQASWIL